MILGATYKELALVGLLLALVLLAPLAPKGAEALARLFSKPT